MPRFRLRVSILTALLLTTIVGMAIVIVQLWRDVGPLRAEVRELRQFVGELSIDDSTKIHAIEVRQQDPNLWRWRLYLPPGPQYKLLTFRGVLPRRGKLTSEEWLAALRNARINNSEETGNHLEGEFVLETKLMPVGDGWKLETFFSNVSSESWIGIKDNWPAALDRIEDSDVWPGQQRVYERGEPILLLYLSKRVNRSARGGGARSQTPPEPAEGIAFWLEPPPHATMPTN